MPLNSAVQAGGLTAFGIVVPLFLWFDTGDFSSLKAMMQSDPVRYCLGILPSMSLAGDSSESAIGAASQSPRS